MQLQVLKVANDDGSCFASLEKGVGKWTYILEWHDGKFVGEHLKPFRPSKENLEKFNNGCRGIANQLEGISVPMIYRLRARSLVLLGIWLATANMCAAPCQTLY